MNVLEDKVIKVEKIAWRDLKWLQSETLKDPIDIDKLVKSLSDNGLIRGFHVWEDENGEIWILDGHHMEKALKIIEQKELILIPEKLTCYFIKCKDKKDAAKMVLLHSASYAKITSEGTWEHLSRFDLDIEELSSSISIDNFDFNEIEKLANQGLEPEAEEDDFEVPDEVVTDIKEGDLIEIGRHRLLCGDSTNFNEVEKLIVNVKPDLVFTDPPYNVSFNGRSGNFEVIKNDNLTESDFEKFIDLFVQVLKKLDPKNYYIWCNWKFYGLLQSKIEFKACIVWAKNVFGLGKGYRHQHEFCLFNGTIDEGVNNESDLWHVKKDTNYKHPTQKPVELANRAFKNHKKSKFIVDLFCGSGLTFIACHQMDKTCYGMELDPKYCQVIIDRMLLLDPEIEVKINGEKYQNQ